MFKEEIASRFEQGKFNVKYYLLECGYLSYLNKEELITLFQSSGMINLPDLANDDLSKSLTELDTLKEVIIISFLKDSLKNHTVNWDLRILIKLLDKEFFQYLTREEIEELIEQFKKGLNTGVRQETEIELLQMICLLYKELNENSLADNYYITLLSHPYINKRIWNMVRSSFPHFSNYRVCEAWRLVKPS